MIECFLKFIKKHTKIIEQKQIGDDYKLIIKDYTDIDYPVYYQIFIKRM